MPEAIVIDQRFTLGHAFRESSIARVYEAKHRNGADAWIKLARAPEHNDALKTEATVAGALGAFAVSVRGEGVAESGLAYLVLDPVAGQRVDHWIQHCGGRAPVDEAMGLGDELCQAAAILHRAGFSFGVLRVESLIVVPRGGMCLVELEHCVPATDESKKEDVALVGRVLYAMLAGRPFAEDAPALSSVAPELPKGILTTVDQAARGGYSDPDELRKALVTAVPPWLGGARRPMPSMSADVEAPVDFSEIVLPRSSSRLLFDPDKIVDSSRPEVVAAQAPQPVTSSAEDVWAQAEDKATSSTTAVAAPPVAPVEPAAPPRRMRTVLVSGAIGTAAAVAVIAVIAFSARKVADTQTAAARAALSASSSAAALVRPSAPAAIPVAKAAEPSVVAPPEEPKPVAAPSASAAAPSASAAPATSAAAAASAAATGDTTFRFEGDLSPRLVFVDNIVIGTTAKKDVHYKCGWHSVKIGGKGLARSIELPCGAEQGIVIEQNGAWRAE